MNSNVRCTATYPNSHSGRWRCTLTRGHFGKHFGYVPATETSNESQSWFCPCRTCAESQGKRPVKALREKVEEKH